MERTKAPEIHSRFLIRADSSEFIYKQSIFTARNMMMP